MELVVQMMAEVVDELLGSFDCKDARVYQIPLVFRRRTYTGPIVVLGCGCRESSEICWQIVKPTVCGYCLEFQCTNKVLSLSTPRLARPPTVEVTAFSGPEPGLDLIDSPLDPLLPLCITL